MQIKTNIDGRKATIYLAGMLTVQTAPDLNSALGELGEGVDELVIDLSETEYIASAGLRVLVTADKMMSGRKGSLLLSHPNDSVVEIFEMTGLSDVFEIER
jgi:anti-sigma B factor antagonist